MAKYKEPDVNQLQFVMINFEELFPAGHPLTQLLNTIRRLDLSEFDANYNNEGKQGGRPALPCDRILAVLVYSLLYGGISMRNLEREISVRADLLYLSGGMKFEHSTMSVFRKRHREAILKLFNQTVFLGVESGFIDLDTVCIDSTKIKGWASRNDIGTREQMEKRYKHVKKVCEKRYKEWERSEEGEKKEHLARRLERAKRQAKKTDAALAFLKEHPERKRVHLHEVDADLQKNSGKGFIVGYNAQAAVDSKSQMFVHTEVVRDQADVGRAVAMVEAVEEVKKEVLPNKKEETKYVLDAGYSSNANLEALQERDIYMPDRQYVRQIGGKTKPEERKEKVPLLSRGLKEQERKDQKSKNEELTFKYISEQDCFECPQGEMLKFRRERDINGVSYRAYRRYGCGNCALREKCIGNRKPSTRREILVLGSKIQGMTSKSYASCCIDQNQMPDYKRKQAMREKLSSEEGKAIYAKRFPVSEGVFGLIKAVRRGNCFLRRGLERVQEEWMERCIAHNLAKLTGFTFT